MSTWLGRVGSMVALLGVTLGALPRSFDPSAHCRTDDRTMAHQTHHHDAPAGPSTRKNTGDAGQCPHCPPADCRRHVQCGSASDSAVLELVAIPSPTAPGAVLSQGPRLPLARSFQPPTPPPQRLL